MINGNGNTINSIENYIYSTYNPNAKPKVSPKDEDLEGASNKTFCNFPIYCNLNNH